MNAVRFVFQEVGALVISSKILDTHGTLHFYLTIKEQLVKAYLYTLERERERKEGGRVRFFLFPLG